jgi:hypothetical protein
MNHFNIFIVCNNRLGNFFNEMLSICDFSFFYLVLSFDQLTDWVGIILVGVIYLVIILNGIWVESNNDRRSYGDLSNFFHGFTGIDSREYKNKDIIKIKLLSKGLINLDKFLLHNRILTNHIDIFINNSNIDGKIHNRTSSFGFLYNFLSG